MGCSPGDPKESDTTELACRYGRDYMSEHPPPQQPIIKLSNTNDHHTGCLCNLKFLYVHFSL